jgi:preprotein translocase subunit SecE
MKRLIQFLKEARLELKKVSWPGRKELIETTTIVIIVSIVTGIGLGLFDIVFSRVVLQLIKLLGS